MRRLRYFLLMFMICGASLFSQNERSEWLFDEFEKGMVLCRDGRQYNVELNYNLISNCFLFKDVTDNDELKEFDPVSRVIMVKVGERSFLVSKNNKVQEILQEKPPVLVEYKGKIRIPKKGAYGTRSETAAIDAIGSYSSGGKIYKLEGDRKVVFGIEKIYEIQVKNKRHTFMNQVRFLKIYSHYKNELTAYMKENKTNFDVTDDVVALVNYVNGLD